VFFCYEFCAVNRHAPLSNRTREEQRTVVRFVWSEGVPGAAVHWATLVQCFAAAVCLRIDWEVQKWSHKCQGWGWSLTSNWRKRLMRGLSHSSNVSFWEDEDWATRDQVHQKKGDYVEIRRTCKFSTLVTNIKQTSQIITDSLSSCTNVSDHRQYFVQFNKRFIAAISNCGSDVSTDWTLE